jgi:hypothetical protein
LPDDRSAATAARLERQRVLRSGDHRFVFLLAEQTLRTRIGTAEIMVEQLDRILGVMALANVTIGIIPAAAGLGAHTQTAFWIFDDSLVKVETLTAALDITRPDEIDIYVTVFNQMRRTAKYGRAARSIILEARDELLKLRVSSMNSAFQRPEVLLDRA